MTVVTVALLQLAACDDQAASLAKGESACRQARQMGADIALFPELWQVGYPFGGHVHQGAPGGRSVPDASADLWRAPALWRGVGKPAGSILPDEVAAFHAWAIGPESEFVAHFRALAAELDLAVALTYLEVWAGAPRNVVSLIDRHGAITLTYAKVHTCDFALPESTLTPGDDFPVCTLDTAQGPIRVGAMICYDREFPESARILMLRGAELILTPNACRLDDVRIDQFQTRAFENMVAVAMANYADSGHSVAFSPVLCDEHGNRLDPLVVEAGPVEGIYLAPFDLDAIRAYRMRETWGNAFRRPHRYGLLTSPDVEEPFVRVDERGARYDQTRR